MPKPPKILSVKSILLKSLRQGDSVQEACVKAKITENTFYEWMKRGQEPLAEGSQWVNQSQAKYKPYYREFYLEVTQIELERQRSQLVVSDEVEQLTKYGDRLRQASQAFDDLLYGRAKVTTTTQKRQSFYKGRTKIEEKVEETTKTINLAPPRWAIEQVLGRADAVEFFKYAVTTGLIKPEAIDEVEELYRRGLFPTLIGVWEKYRADGAKLDLGFVSEQADIEVMPIEEETDD